jgi:hypothetical protein
MHDMRRCIKVQEDGGGGLRGEYGEGPPPIRNCENDNCDGNNRSLTWIIVFDKHGFTNINLHTIHSDRPLGIILTNRVFRTQINGHLP